MVLSTNILEAKTSNLVTKSNKLIEANYKLGIIEQKIILSLASTIQPTDNDFKTYTLPVREFCNLLGLTGAPKYSELKRITKELMQKVFEIRIDNKVIQVAWLSYVAYNETEGSIDLRFDPFLRPYLLELKKEFTSYRLENVVKLKSSYAIRLYELLKQYEKIKERTFSLSDLRKLLGVEDIYPAYGNFKQRVIIPAQKELKKKTDIYFEFEEVKFKRRVEKVKFIILTNKTSKKEELQLSFFNENPDEVKLSNLFIDRVKKLGMKLGVNIPNEIIGKWAEHGQDNVLSLLEKIQNRKDIDNPIGYITTILNSTPITNVENSMDLEDQSVLTHLVSRFRKSKDRLPSWFIRDNAIKEIQDQYKLDSSEALIQYEKIKSDLFEILEIEDLQQDLMNDEEFIKEKMKLEEELRNFKKV
ncbi:replication initiation protein [Bacillus massilinigeriensis]|uniref:replication initiation protein n=1 Tax=Bacillus massilionigeriensis TaxID=1805475 RepID=UPI00096B1181|nr:replication initiation protein [Bacillus massilionigeriensis]